MERVEEGHGREAGIVCRRTWRVFSCDGDERARPVEPSA